MQGKIATVLYSAFGVPLMMLFVTNSGLTMARLFAFVFSRIKLIFCCRWRSKKKRLNFKNLHKNNPITIAVDEKASVEKIATKSSFKRITGDKDMMDKSKENFYNLKYSLFNSYI